MDLKAKVGPLPVWGWGVVGLGAGGLYYWYRSRQSGGAADTAAGVSADQGGALGYTDQGSALGYLGYGGTGAGGSSGTGTSTGGSNGGGGTSTAANGGKFCRDVKDPSGATRHVCGYGHWYRKTVGGHWFWTPGPIPAKDPKGKAGIHSVLERSGPGSPPGWPTWSPAQKPPMRRGGSGTEQPLTGAVASGLATAAVA
jgi:hypothetical protein